MNWEKFDESWYERLYERYRYTMTIVWMNTIGLIVSMVLIIKTMRKAKNIYTKTEKAEELKKVIAKLLIGVGIIGLAVYWLWVSSKLLLIISLVLIILGICGRIAQGMGRFIDEFVS
ncbi:MAG TPA: hypothetical protein PKC87_05250 [Candidatus Absconditabacterales bacterium]|nr:hypothetical protein [Candidatus Absconditabacterales bacterium]